MVQFNIPGRVRGKGRPRFARAGNFVRTFTDVKTKSDEAMVRHFASQAMAGLSLLDGPVAVTIQATIQPPASWSKKRRAAALWVTGKPDCDNAAKLICDSMNGIVFADDAQISDLHFRRRYSLTEPEHVWVSVSALVEVRPATITGKREAA